VLVLVLVLVPLSLTVVVPVPVPAPVPVLVPVPAPVPVPVLVMVGVTVMVSPRGVAPPLPLPSPMPPPSSMEKKTHLRHPPQAAGRPSGLRGHSAAFVAVKEVNFEVCSWCGQGTLLCACCSPRMPAPPSPPSPIRLLCVAGTEELAKALEKASPVVWMPLFRAHIPPDIDPELCKGAVPEPVPLSTEGSLLAWCDPNGCCVCCFCSRHADSQALPLPTGNQFANQAREDVVGPACKNARVLASGRAGADGDGSGPTYVSPPTMYPRSSSPEVGHAHTYTHATSLPPCRSDWQALGPR
jgi:hypothetical protein